MNASTLVICRDETDPRRVRISGTKADHLVLFSHTIPLTLLKEILARIERDPKATVRLKAEESHWRCRRAHTTCANVRDGIVICHEDLAVLHSYHD